MRQKSYLAILHNETLRESRLAKSHKSREWKLGSLEVWMLGGAPEVESRAAAPGGDETGRCAAFTKDTKNHEGTQRSAILKGTADYAD